LRDGIRGAGLASVPLFVFLLVAACGDRGGSDQPGVDLDPGSGPDMGGAVGVPGGSEEEDAPEFTLALTFTREEAPVQVTRRVEVRRAPGISQEESLLRVALTALLQGPLPEEREMGIHSFFGPGTEGLLRDVALRGDTAVVDFGDLPAAIPNAGSSTGSFHFLMELNGTVFAIPGLEAVEYRMDGSCEAFWNFLQRGCQVVPRPGSAE
jgi:hypothetical protein